MLTKRQKQLISYEPITIYEKNYQLPIIKNLKLKRVQKRIRNSQVLIKEGIKYDSYFFGTIKRKKNISQREVFGEIKLLIRDYTQLIDYLENYKDSYKTFLLKFTDDWENLFTQKYLEIKNLSEERNKLEIKYQKNPQLIDKLKQEKQENIKSMLLLSNSNLLMLKKIQFLSEGIKKLSEDTKNQKQTIQQIVKDLELYQEIYEYQIRATKVRQEIAKIAETVINLENNLQQYFSPFQSLIDEVVKIDADFYTTVEEIRNLASNTLNEGLDLLTIEETNTSSEEILNLLVASYEKKDRLNNAFIQCQSLDWGNNNFELSDDKINLDRAIYLTFNYLSNQLVAQRKVLGIPEANIVSHKPRVSIKTTQIVGLSNNDVTSTNNIKSNKSNKSNKTNRNIDYSQLQNLLAQGKWEEADIETAKLMLKVLGKNYWNEVYKEDMQNFSCKALNRIDKLWKQYSNAYFGFSIQQNIWNEIGGEVDYGKEKIFGERLGWREEGKWLEYDRLNFKLSPTTPIGHLPVKWLHYDQKMCELSSNSFAEPFSMGAWRVQSWLIWQMHLFFSSGKIDSGSF